MNQPRLKIGQGLILILLAFLLLMPIIYNRYSPSGAFMDNAMSNMLGSVLALLGGVPIALWINSLIRADEYGEKYILDRKRETKILKLIKEELDFSLNSLFLKGKKGNKVSITIQPLKMELWESLIASEETKFIEDPDLLNRITSAYYVLKVIRNIEIQAYIALRTSAIKFTLPDGTQKNPAELLLEDARNFDALFESSMNEALKMIDKRLNNQTTVRTTWPTKKILEYVLIVAIFIFSFEAGNLFNLGSRQRIFSIFSIITAIVLEIVREKIQANIRGDGVSKISAGPKEPEMPQTGDLWIDTSDKDKK